MLVQWPWGPQEAAELHSSTSVGMGVSQGVQSRDTLDGIRWSKGSGGGGGKCLVLGRPGFPDPGDHDRGSCGSGFLGTPYARILGLGEGTLDWYRGHTLIRVRGQVL